MKKMKTALLVIDIQNDFVEGGNLGVNGGSEVVPIVNELIGKYDFTVATQDFHPAGHSSFANQGGIWPDHCVQGTTGADFHELLNVAKFDKVVQKGTNPKVDSYSGFYDNDHVSQTGLAEYLRENAVTDLVVVGIATDYCVKFTALDGKNEGFNVKVVKDACRAVNIQPEDEQNALDELAAAGVEVTTFEEVTA